MTVHYRTEAVRDVEVFYREAGPADAPVILLLHGYPTASHMFRDLIPHLENRFRLIAPDLPGFGQTKAPPRGTFDYTFDNLADVIDGFTQALGLSRYALYIFDFGAPTGLRLAAAHPERVVAIISQNGNAYEEGLGPLWTLFRKYWDDPSQDNRDACRVTLTPEITKSQYTMGSDASLLAPDGYELDIAYLNRPEHTGSCSASERNQKTRRSFVRKTLCCHELAPLREIAHSQRAPESRRGLG
jgi:pimeloyl-ACP methyl ester carboxylesterase